MVGIWSGIASGIFWTLAAIFSVNYPRLTRTAGILNAFAAVLATATVCYSIPDKVVLLIKAEIGLP
jgi:hypothetical protein